MDSLTCQIADFAVNSGGGRTPPAVVSQMKVRIVDTLGCALGGRDSEAARIGLALGEGAIPKRYPGRVVGRPERTTAETAAFVNSAMARYLDFNDTGPGSHPSDCLGPMFAVGEAVGASGMRLIEAGIVAYEVLIRLAFGTKFRQLGFDQGFACAVGTAAGTGHLLGLPLERVAHAVSIAAVSNIPLRASRAGNLSYWKSAATPFHVRNGMTAALLAAEGMTGPEKPFEGRFGLWEQLTKEFTIEPFPTAGGDFLLPRWSRLKFWPVEYNAQISVWAALNLRSQMPADQIETVEICTYHQAWHEIGSEQAKWNPTTRETADHSLPYIFARTLLDGEISIRSFEEAKYTDPIAKALMQRIVIKADDAFTARFPASIPVRVTATSKSGEVLTIEMENPLGHNLNPMTDADISKKFRGLAEPVLGTGRASEAFDAWWSLDEATSLTPALDLLEPGR